VLSLISLLMAFIINFFILSPLIYETNQTKLRSAFSAELSQATAPTSEMDFLGKLLPAGVPVAAIEIPKLDLNEIVVEGTDSDTMRTGLGHRRDTVLPGQEGICVLFGRAWSYGGPFRDLGQLKKGDEVVTYTGQGKSNYVVTAVRYAGDKGLAPVKVGTSTLVLTSAQGQFFVPSQVVRVDAELVGKTFDSGIRATKWGNIGLESRELGSDASSLWLMSLVLLAILIIELLALWSVRKFGIPKTWIVFTPLLTLSFILFAEQITRLLPNLL
jgi:LPXTG-site transpeptidase (sortase) family protein